MSKQTKNNTIYRIKGVSCYSCTGKKNTGGKYPSKMYEVGIIPDNIEELPPEIAELLKDTALPKIDKNGKVVMGKDGKPATITVKTLKAKSNYKYPMWNMNDDELEKNVSIPNDCPIECAFRLEHSAEYDCDFLSCLGIKFLKFVPEKFNPFK